MSIPVLIRLAWRSQPTGGLRETPSPEKTVALVEMQQTVRDLIVSLHVIYEERDTAMLRLQLRKQNRPLVRQRVMLSNAERRLASRLTSASGEVVFQRLAHGTYTIAIPQEHVETACVLCPDVTRQSL